MIVAESGQLPGAAGSLAFGAALIVGGLLLLFWLRRDPSVPRAMAGEWLAPKIPDRFWTAYRKASFASAGAIVIVGAALVTRGVIVGL